MRSKVHRGRQGQATAYMQLKGSRKESLMKAEIFLGDSEYWYSQKDSKQEPDFEATVTESETRHLTSSLKTAIGNTLPFGPIPVLVGIGLF